MNRRNFLLSSAAGLGLAGVTWPRRLAAENPAGKNLVVVLAVGGWDVTYCFDPKLDCVAPTGDSCFLEGPEVDLGSHPQDVESVEVFAGVPVVVNPWKRPAVGDFFRRWGSMAHVVNGLWTGSIAHDPCRFRILTGTPDATRPDLATMVGHVLGGDRPLGSIDLSGWSLSGALAASSGRVGYRSQLEALIDPSVHFRAPAGSAAYPLFSATDADQAQIDAWVAARAQALRARSSLGNGRSEQVIQDLLDSLDRAARFQDQVGSSLAALTLGVESRFPQQVQMAVDLIDQQVCRAVTVDTTFDWDTHDRNRDQHLYFQDLFLQLDLLMSRLEARGRLQDTVVAVLSEMTRTPLRNAAGGKDHWGHTSALLLGAVRGGAVSGGTDHYLESLPVDLRTGRLDPRGQLNRYDNFVAGMLELVGVEPASWLPGVTPFRGAHP